MTDEQRKANFIKQFQENLKAEKDKDKQQALNAEFEKLKDRPQLPSTQLLPKYSQKAVFLKGVDERDAVYRPAKESVVESMVFAAQPVDKEQTGVACKRVGKGRVAYVGDVNAEEGSARVVLGMCGL